MGQRLTDRAALEQQAGSGDLLMVVDVNDTQGSPEGTSKQMDFKYLMQTDKISVTSAEFHALPRTRKNRSESSNKCKSQKMFSAGGRAARQPGFVICKI